MLLSAFSQSKEAANTGAVHMMRGSITPAGMNDEKMLFFAIEEQM
ncbi:hypothetical protein F652_4099 [Enterobacteriaceae bacterium bta3-1]|nr:hypothetical protein F652_4099 [Enterobacteriaceae bacterium bta3-1]